MFLIFVLVNAQNRSIFLYVSQGYNDILVALNAYVEHDILMLVLPIGMLGLLMPSSWRYGLFVLAVVFILFAFNLPTDWLLSQIITSTPEQDNLSFMILRVCFGMLGLASVISAVIPQAWLQSQGLPRRVSGSNIDVDGWSSTLAPTHWVLLASILGLGFTLRVIGLNRDFWIDEIATIINYMRGTFLQTISTYESANQHLLYSVLGQLSIKLLGESEWAARLPAVILGLVGLVSLYYLARLITTEREAILATALLTFSYHHVWFSQNARGYTGLLVASTLGTALLLNALSQNKLRHWLAYVVVMACGILFLLNTVFVFMSHFILYFLTLLTWDDWQRKHLPLTLRMILSGAAVTLLVTLAYSLMLPQMFEWYSTVDRVGLGWSNPLEFANVIWEGLQAGFAILPAPILLAGFIFGGAFGLISWWTYLRQSLLIGGLLVLPIALNLGILLFFGIGAYPRSFLYVLPFAILLLVRGFTLVFDALAHRVWRKTTVIGNMRLSTIAVCGLIGLSALSTLYNYRYPKQNYTGTHDYIQQQQNRDDVVVALGVAANGYRDYYDDGTLHYPDSVAALQTLETTYDDVWVIYSFTQDMRLRFGTIYDYVQDEYELVAQFAGTLGDGTMYVMRSND